jgi:hypothetical protein
VLWKLFFATPVAGYWVSGKSSCFDEINYISRAGVVGVLYSSEKLGFAKFRKHIGVK